MTRKRLNIGHLFRLASTINIKPIRDSKSYLTEKEILADWLITAYATNTITLTQLADYLSAVDQCHDEVANVLLAFARAEV